MQILSKLQANCLKFNFFRTFAVSFLEKILIKNDECLR